MKFRKLQPAEFVWRDTRFTAAVRIDNGIQRVHIANTGRLPGLLNPGAKVWVSAAGHLNRRTKYDLKIVESRGGLVCIDTRMPNVVFEEALVKRNIDMGYPLSTIEREKYFNNSRLDFKLTHEEKICWVETKSVTLVINSTALFPDAPTSRGAKHLKELIKINERGQRSAIIFIVQRSDANKFSPNWGMDPEFSELLIQAHRNAVELKAFCCHVGLSEIFINHEIPIELMH